MKNKFLLIITTLFTLYYSTLAYSADRGFLSNLLDSFSGFSDEDWIDTVKETDNDGELVSTTMSDYLNILYFYDNNHDVIKKLANDIKLQYEISTIYTYVTSISSSPVKNAETQQYMKKFSSLFYENFPINGDILNNEQIKWSIEGRSKTRTFVMASYNNLKVVVPSYEDGDYIVTETDDIELSINDKNFKQCQNIDQEGFTYECSGLLLYYMHIMIQNY